MDGYVLDDREYSIELKWKDDQTPVVIDSSGSTDTNGILSVVNNLARPKLSLVKKTVRLASQYLGLNSESIPRTTLLMLREKRLLLQMTW